MRLLPNKLCWNYSINWVNRILVKFTQTTNSLSELSVSHSYPSYWINLSIKTLSKIWVTLLWVTQVIKHQINYLLNERVKSRCFSLMPRLLSKSFHPEYGARFDYLDSESSKLLNVLKKWKLLIKMKENMSHFERQHQHKIFFNQGMLLLGSNHFLINISLRYDRMTPNPKGLALRIILMQHHCIRVKNVQN